MNSRVPVRWRLTVWNAAIITGVLLLFGIAIYIGQRLLLYDNYDEQAREQVDVALSAISVNLNGPALAPSTIDSLSDDEHFVRLIDSGGRTQVDTSGVIGGIPLDQGLIQTAMSGSDARSVWNNDAESFVLWTVPVRDGDQIIGVLQTGTSRSDADEILRLQVIAMVIAAPIILIAAVLGGYVLAGRALQPVDEITELAAKIDVNDLHARLNLPLPNDELGRLSRTFDSMLARIEDAFERQRRFTGDAAHELRTPLSVMQGQIDLALSDDRTTAEYHQAFLELNEDLARLTRLVETLLALSRSEGSGFHLDLARLDLPETIELIREQYEAAVANLDLKIITNLHPAALRADRDLIIQLLVNLTDNAIVHTPAGGTVTLGCHRVAADVSLWVSDSGIGISSEHLERVFDRFYRIDLARSRSRGGVGLGLAICKSIVDAHNGTISIASQPGTGTTVTVVLPITEL